MAMPNDEPDPSPNRPRNSPSGGAPPLQKPEGGRGFTEDPVRPMPSSADAEKGVLSCMLQDPENLINEVVVKVGAECFYVPANRLLFERMVDRFNNNEGVDIISLTQSLRDKGDLEPAGGAAAVTELIDFVPTTAHLTHYLDLLVSKHTLRGIITSCTECITRAYDDQENVNELLDDVERKVLEIRDSAEDTNIRTMKTEVLEAVKNIHEIFKNRGELTGLGTGLKKLDQNTNGLHGGEMFIIAARPSMGKTSLAMNIVEHVALQEDKSVAVFSLEMSTQQLIQRMICSQAGIEMSKLRGGFLSEADFPRIMAAADVMANSKILIDDTPAISILELRAKARRMKKSDDIQLIAVDYLQLLRSTSRRGQDNRQIEISEISSGLKALAKELNIPIIVLAQLNRGPENRTDGRPKLSDLRESGSIEQDADVVGLLVRSAYYAESEEDRDDRAGEAELIIAKQRNGPTGEIPLTFLDKYMRFVDRAYDDEPK